MSDPILIIEVLGRSEQGATRPFLCRGEDKQLYYVKGRYAGLRSLCCEWVAGRLAQEMGLATPEIAMVEVPEKLIKGSDRPDIQDLGVGLAFGSARVEGAQEVTWEAIREVSPDEKARILLLDWWVQNEDRTLSACGGNPNLLVTPVEREWENDLFDDLGSRRSKLWTFDFNLAFDVLFDDDVFWDGHLFAPERTRWLPAFRSEMEKKMEWILGRFLLIWAELPPEWLYIDADENLPMQLDLDVVMEVLRRPFDRPAEFWRER